MSKEALRSAVLALEHISSTHRNDLIEDYAKKVLAIDPKNLFALEHLARAYNNMRRYEDLRSVCEQGIRDWPGQSYLYYMFHLYYLAKGGEDYLNARDLLREALRIDPSVGLYYRELAEVYLINWEPAKARDLLKTAVNLRPENMEFLARYALALLRCRDLKRAFEAARSAIAKCPDDEAVLNSVGQVFLFGGELTEAEDLFREALRRYPTYEYYQRQLINCLREIRDRDSRLKQRKRYTPLVLRQRGSKRFFDEDLEKAIA